ncbi:CHAT domain-containing protein [Roseivirga sp.]|uniref:CHAT domain-containing protein n=1 Tax=Roseivirga sp. TaxID=1964215 RepID=UPI002B273310|nr:CHAT domain-containing protein [Roseivirga sp.]
MKRYFTFFTLICLCQFTFAQVSVPPAKLQSHPSYAAYQQAKQANNASAMLNAAIDLMEVYPENSQAFILASTALYDSNKPTNAVDLAKWSVAYNSYETANGYYGFIYAVFANMPDMAHDFLRNMQAMGADATTMQRNYESLSSYVNSLSAYPQLASTVQKANGYLTNFSQESVARAKATFENLASTLGATYEGIANNETADKTLADWIAAEAVVKQGLISRALYNDALVSIAGMAEKVNFPFGQKLEPHLEKIVFDQVDYNIASRYRAYVKLASLQASLKRWDKVESASNLMLADLKGNIPSNAVLAKIYFYHTMALTEQRKLADASAMADAYVNILPKLKSPEYLAEAYYVILRAYAFNKEVEKGKAIVQRAENFLKIPGVDKYEYFNFAKNGLSTTANILGGEGGAELTGSPYNDGIRLMDGKQYAEAVVQFEKAREEEIAALEKLDPLAQRGYLDKFQRINGFLAATYYETKQFEKIYDVIESNRAYSLLNDKRSKQKQLPLKDLQATLGANEAYLSFIDVSKGSTYEGTYLMCLVTKNEVFTRYNRSAGAFVDLLENDPELVVLEKELAQQEFRSPNLDYLTGEKTRKLNMFGRGEFKLMTQYLRKHMEAKVVDNQYVFFQKEKMPDLLKRFHITFIDGLEEKLQGITKLTISPEGLIGTIPFDALIDINGRYLAERFEIGYIPNAAMLYTLRSQPKKTYEKNILGFGGATYENYSVAKAPLNSLGDLEKLRYRVREDLQKNQPLDYAFATFQGEEPMVFLEGGRQEVVIVKDIIPNSETRLDEMMTENELKRMSTANELGKYKAVHLSSHASVHPYVFDLSGIAMTVKSAPVNGEDGMLVVGELEKLNLPVDFVMLSACQTALGVESPGDGIKGLNQALFNAGVNSSLTSLWSVSDTGTMYLSVELYGRMFKEKMATTTALAQVKRNFIAGAYGDQTHPYFWAPFIYTGY